MLMTKNLMYSLRRQKFSLPKWRLGSILVMNWKCPVGKQYASTEAGYEVGSQFLALLLQTIFALSMYLSRLTRSLCVALLPRHVKGFGLITVLAY